MKNRFSINLNRFVAGLIVKPELSQMNFDLNNDRSINRYYHYIYNGADTIHVTHIQNDFLTKIKNLLPKSLRLRYPDKMETLIEEIKNDFKINMKKTVVEFALIDPRETNISSEVKTC